MMQRMAISRRGRVNLIYHTFASGDRSVDGIDHAVMINGVALATCWFCDRICDGSLTESVRERG